MRNYLYLISIFLLGVVACSTQSKKKESVDVTENGKVYKHVDWAKNANIYEVNVRQYTSEGTFNAFAKEMPRLKKMGVDILWIMPIHPIGEINRKGKLGSYYAVKDYQKVNPEFGTLDDFKSLVTNAHKLGMKVIIDWVANHTAWDNWMVKDHPEWYTKDSLNNIVAPVEDWKDVADLNYDVPELRAYMIQSMEYWIKNADIDGFRCDVAGMVPTDFWVEARKKLDAIKPVFMLAENDTPEILDAFDMVYGWELHHTMNDIAQGKKTVKDLVALCTKIDTVFQKDDYIMNFTSNHDENTWNGSEYERMGDAVQAMAVLAATMPGMPLIYTGQEAKLDKRLNFFDKDTIEWNNYPLADFYTKLLTLKKENKALWNGVAGGDINILENSGDNVFTFYREKDGNKVVVLLNLSDKTQTVSINSPKIDGNYSSLFDGDEVEVNKDSQFDLKPWGYIVLY